MGNKGNSWDGCTLAVEISLSGKSKNTFGVGEEIFHVVVLSKFPKGIDRRRDLRSDFHLKHLTFISL
jgi:hypothetical protein